MANQSYTGVVTAAYVNLSKKNKEYATGYIQLPDANGANQSYKFLIFDDTEVANLKAFGPDALKGQRITMDGEFKENTWNGNTEYQLMVAHIHLPEADVNTGAPGTPSVPGGTPSTPSVPNTTVSEVAPVTPEVPSVPEVPSAPSTPSASNEIPTVPTVPNIPTPGV